MAKRSDFAQKLLDDLRLRKERLAASQSSNRTKPSAADAYAQAKKNYRGSRELKTTEAAGFRNGTLQNRSSRGGNKSLIGGEATKQIVPFGRGQNSEHIGDLSMAVAFALENGGKLRRMDSSVNNSMLGFLHQLGSTSLDYDKMARRNSMDRRRPSTSNFPALSQLHIKEISKGAQKLNQILRSCSNGVNFDSYSIEVGKELLKGAVNLEESLRMLVNLQEASEYMISPQRKTRITLLEEDEEEDDDNTIKNAEQKQLGLPQFSFDKRSRNYQNIHEVARNDLMLRLAAVAYPTEANFIYEKQSASHKRSASTGPNAKTSASFSEQKNRSSSSQSKPEKGRIPNVIAKLMGLDELPENVDSNYTTAKDSGSKKKAEEKLLKRTVQASTKKVKKRTENIENLAPQTPKKKVMQPNKSPAVQNTVAFQAETGLASRNTNFEVIHDRKPSWKDLEVEKPIMGSERVSIKVDKQQGNVNRLNHNIGSLKDTQEKYRDQKGVERSKMKEPALKDELQWTAPETHNRSEAAVYFQEKMGHKGGVLQTESIYTNKVLVGTRQKSPNNLGFQQPHMLRRSEPREEKRQAEEKEQQNAKQKLPMRKQKGSELISTPLSKPMHQAAASKKSFTETVDAMQSERYPSVRHHENLASKRSPTTLNVNTRSSMSKNSNQNTSPRDQEPKLMKTKAVIPSLVEKKPVHESGAWKAESVKIHKREIPPKINEVMIRRGGTMQNSGKPLKNQNSIFQEVKQRSVEFHRLKEVNQVRASKTKEAELNTIKSSKSVAIIQSPIVAQEPQQKSQQASILHSPVQEENQSVKEPETLATTDSCQDITSVVMEEHQDQEPILGEDEELKSHIIESTPLSGIHQDNNSDMSYPSQLEHQKLSKPETPEPLTESENHLKQILIKSQLFLNTAEALFKLNIPYGILDAGGGRDCQDEDSKVTLDCSYEVMKRKGRKQELSVHPFVKVSITAKRARSLDDLVVELNKDLEKLKFYGRNGNAEAAIEDYLPKMLECDVHNKDPDVNSMWDLSWDEMMFAFIEKDDVVRDVERCVLTELVDEITLDLLPVHVF
ncbi:hypothetical protein ACOSQ4_011039 [Xanthoceras sorbifolium]